MQYVPVHRVYRREFLAFSHPSQLHYPGFGTSSISYRRQGVLVVLLLATAITISPNRNGAKELKVQHENKPCMIRSPLAGVNRDCVDLIAVCGEG